MEIADSFIPTAGAVGLLPMVTYFFLVVAMLAFLGLFIFSLVAQPFGTPIQARPVSPLTTVITTVAGCIYYLIQAYQHDMLAALATVSEGNDRQTFIRESYNAISQYRDMVLFITTPLLVFQLLSLLQLRPGKNKHPFVRLLVGCWLLVFATFIGHQQLSFDNEIQAGPFALWGFIALVAFGFLAFTVNRLSKEFNGQDQPGFRIASLIMGAAWVIYLVSYFLALSPINPNWIQLLVTIADMGSMIGIGLLVYSVNINRTVST